LQLIIRDLTLYTYILSIDDVSLKTKIMNIITAHPKLVTFGIGLGITFVIGTAIGVSQAYAGTAHGMSSGLGNK
jgi:hypothetical protein